MHVVVEGMMRKPALQSVASPDDGHFFQSSTNSMVEYNNKILCVFVAKEEEERWRRRRRRRRKRVKIVLRRGRMIGRWRISSAC